MPTAARAASTVAAPTAARRGRPTASSTTRRRPAPVRFLSCPIERQHPVAIQARGRHRQPQPADDLRLPLLLGESGQQRARPARGHHAHRHRCPVAQAPGHLDGVADGVPVVEVGPLAALQGVPAHDRRLHRHRPPHHLRQVGAGAVALVERHQAGVAHQAGLQGLGRALAPQRRRAGHPGLSASTTTRAGWWKAPTRFLAPRFRAVLPPMEASTAASRVVGTKTASTPRKKVAATKPADVGQRPAAHPQHRVVRGVSPRPASHS